MAPGQIRTANILQSMTTSVMKALNSKPKTCTAPSDGRVLRMHYQWTMWLMLTGFASVFYQWFYKDIIHCVSHFNADTQVRLDYLNTCLSYPFVIQKDGSHKHLLFYRWIHWVFLLMALAYCIPRKLSKKGENPKVKKLFDDLASMNERLEAPEKQMINTGSQYIILNNNSNNGLFYKYLAWNVACLVIDILAFLFLDMLLLNRFFSLVPQSYPFTRDGEYLTDYISETFPPFVKCDIGPVEQLTNERKERFGCHLMAMELYEKLFIAVWLWLILVCIVTVIYICFLGTFFFPSARRFILMFSKPFSAENRVREVIEKVSTKSQVGDWFLLYKIRQHFSPLAYYKLMKLLGDEDSRRAVLDNARAVFQIRKSDPKHVIETMKPHKSLLFD